jgi:copper(I)-binding protein
MSPPVSPDRPNGCLRPAGPVEVTGAWVRATPPGARTAAAYLTLTNHGPADRLLGAASPAAQELQLHTVATDGPTQRMLPLQELALPPGGTVRFEPGGLHLMLLDIAAPLVPGATIVIELRFAAAPPLALEVPVVDGRTGTAVHEHR